MPSNYTIRDLFDEFASELELSWDGEGGVEKILLDSESPDGLQPVGPLNLIRPNQIQVIGPPEQQHMMNGGE
ncbi:MAG: hypothetical protein AB2704_01325, partial [Candidatus Thiodiazotropha taylori]